MAGKQAHGLRPEYLHLWVVQDAKLLEAWQILYLKCLYAAPQRQMLILDLLRHTIEMMQSNHLPGGKFLPEPSVSMFSESVFNGVGFGLGFSVLQDPTQIVIPRVPLGSARSKRHRMRPTAISRPIRSNQLVSIIVRLSMFNAMRNCFFSQPSNRAPITLVVCLTLALVTPLTLQAQPKALARDRWPNTVEQAVPHIIQALKPAQRSIVQGTSKDNLMMLQGEWGEDIEVLLGLDKGNSPLAQAACGRPCTSDQAAFELMKVTWEALQRSAPRQ